MASSKLTPCAPMVAPPRQQMLSEVVERKRQRTEYRAELVSWIESLQQKKKGIQVQDELVSVQNRLRGREAAEMASMNKLRKMDELLEELNAKEDELLHGLLPPTKAWQWAAAADAARRPEAKEFLGLMAAHKLQQEATSASRSSSSTHQVPEDTSAPRSSKRPRSPPKPAKPLSSSKGAYVD